MNLKVKAGLIVVGSVATAVVATLATKLAIANIPSESIPTIIAGAMIGVLLYTMYSMVLTKLETDEKYQTKLKEMVDQK
jgi:anaerobic C4-dicarboxylate transporter